LKEILQGEISPRKIDEDPFSWGPSTGSSKNLTKGGVLAKGETGLRWTMGNGGEPILDQSPNLRKEMKVTQDCYRGRGCGEGFSRKPSLRAKGILEVRKNKSGKDQKSPSVT